MNLLIATVGAAGLLLLVSSLPPLRKPRLRSRVEPYLGGLGGRPSRLLNPAGRGISMSHRVRALTARFFPVRDAGLETRLQSSGLGLSMDSFRLEQVTWGFAASMAATVGLLILRSLWQVDLRAIPPMVLIGFATGFLSRDWWLGRQIEQRRLELAEELPAALDLVTLSIMAGESVGAACERVSLALPSGIGREFAYVIADVRAGSPIIESLERMAGRVPAPEVGRFVDALSTGIEKGAPLAETLRAQADDGREARRRRLMELGGRKEVLMLVPVVFLIMPVVVLFALYPGLVSLDLLVP